MAAEALGQKGEAQLQPLVREVGDAAAAPARDERADVERILGEQRQLDEEEQVASPPPPGLAALGRLGELEEVIIAIPARPQTVASRSVHRTCRQMSSQRSIRAF